MVKNVFYLTITFGIVFAGNTFAQQKILTLKEALKIALTNYGTLKSRANYVEASRASLQATRREYLPDLNISAQQDYGTVNGQSGPLYGFRGLSASSGGPPLETQNWKTAFGALYLANINWDVYSFGRVRERIKLARTMLQRDEYDLEQEKFQHQVRVAAAYLNLVAAQRLTRSQQNNLERTTALRDVVVTRTKTGLNAGVDSSLANAEVSAAKIALVNARDFEQEQSNELALLMGIIDQNFITDTLFLGRIPASINDSVALNADNHPVLQYYQSLVSVSQGQAAYFQTFNYPTISLFGVIQARGSGFSYNYGEQYPEAYSKNYLDGVRPKRGNYLTGVGLIWNLTTPLRTRQQVYSQKFISMALKDEYEQAGRQLKNQAILAEKKIANAMANYREAPVQVKAAADAYLQKSVLYKNGLTTIVEVTQALFAVNRAETDRDIAFNNVWQALLLKSAASGDFSLFTGSL